jgi:3-hydroxybutyryl-CoA dehydrogenase
MSAPLVVIIGTGHMAPGIALACRHAGADVRIAGRDDARAAVAAAEAGVAAAPLERKSFDGAAVVIETVIEDLAVKRELLARVEGWTAPHTVVATNTSSLSIDALAEALDRPERLAGLHFLYPAEHTDVVEVIAGSRTDADAHELLVALVEGMGKHALVVRRDIPGFIWNRLQFAVLRECLHLLDEGVADAESIDAAVSDGLAPRWLAGGPLATADLGGLETFRSAAGQLFGVLSDAGAVPGRLDGARPFYAWSDASRDAVEALRADVLATGRELARRRRAIAPPPADK